MTGLFQLPRFGTSLIIEQESRPKEDRYEDRFEHCWCAGNFDGGGLVPARDQYFAGKLYDRAKPMGNLWSDSRDYRGWAAGICQPTRKLSARKKLKRFEAHAESEGDERVFYQRG